MGHPAGRAGCSQVVFVGVCVAVGPIRADSAGKGRQASLGVSSAGALAIDSPARSARMPGGTVGVTAAVVAILVLAGVSLVSAATSAHLEHPTAAGLYQGYMVAASLLVALYWFLQRPGSAFGPLLAAFGVSAWVVSWQSSDWPLVFDIGVLAEAVAFVLTFYLFSGVPERPAADARQPSAGRGGGRSSAVLRAVGAVVAGDRRRQRALGLPPCVPGQRPAGGLCPRRRGVSGALGELRHARAGDRRHRRVLAARDDRLASAAQGADRGRGDLVAVPADLLHLPLLALILHADPSTLEWMSWVLVGSRVLLPLGFLVALIQARLFAGAVTRTAARATAVAPFAAAVARRDRGGAR